MSEAAIRRHPASGTFARALFAVGEARGEADLYAEELNVLTGEVFVAGTLGGFFQSPRIPRSEKKKVIEHALAGKVSRNCLNLLLILIDRGRQELLWQIAAAYQELLDARRGRVHAKITTTVPPDPKLHAELVEALGKKLSKQIIADSRLDPRLLGGMKIQIGDTVIDGTVRTRLKVVGDAMGALRLGRELVNEN